MGRHVAAWEGEHVLESADLALFVELVVQGSLDAGVHGGRVFRQTMAVAAVRVGLGRGCKGDGVEVELRARYLRMTGADVGVEVS